MLTICSALENFIKFIVLCIVMVKILSFAELVKIEADMAELAVEGVDL